MTPSPSGSGGRGLEALAIALLGAAAGWFVGGLLHPAVGIVMAIVAGANGAISGWRGIYAWRQGDGALTFLLDSTWASLPVALGLIAHVFATLSKGARYEASLSHRQGRHVYRGGVQLKKGFAFTVGNVISGAGEIERPSRRKLITDHEAVHVRQARWFGPIYPVVYVLWSIAGVAAGLVMWLRRGRKEPLPKMVETCSYYLNPFEWWAYSRDGLWPPSGKVAGVGWRKPVVRPMAEVRAARLRAATERAALKSE